jgi:hypothetical protein
MNRRKFGILGASSMAALSVGLGDVRPARAAVNAGLLKTTLTPFGADRAGNADGTIPAWTGGMAEVPSGVTPGQGLMPDFFANDAKLISIDASNMEQYKDKLAEGTMLMMQKYGLRIDVYPTHRTASAPQWVYDNIYKNATSATLDPHGAKYGFGGAYGGIPFPILDPDPSVAGAQVMWNHAVVWQGTGYTRAGANYIVDSNGVLTLAAGYSIATIFDYYQPDKTIADYQGYSSKAFVSFNGPASLVGEEAVTWSATNTLQTQDHTWGYIPGEGRVRETPDLYYDTPAPSFDDYANSDEYEVFGGALDRYDWTLVGKKEMYIPYNNNKLLFATPEQGHQPHFINPDYVRWELHRCWVVDAVVSPGQRNVLHHRRFYIDEDAWNIGVGDSWDAQGNYWHHGMLFIENRPDIPAGAKYTTTAVFDLQFNRYLTNAGNWNVAPYNGPMTIGNPPLDLFDPRTMASQNQF